MDDNNSDLLTLISGARRLVTDDRYIWCCASDGFDSRCVQRRGLLLGGALSPHFLRDTPGCGRRSLDGAAPALPCGGVR
jgi:hypothetical protein